MDPTHPLGVETGQVVVDRDEVDALATETVEVRRQGADQGLALTGLHLGDPAEVQRRATHQLHVEVALADHPAGGLANDGERLDQQVVEALATLERPRNSAVLACNASSLSALIWLRKRVDVGNQAFEGLQLLTFTGSEDAIEDAHAGMQPTGGGGADLGNARVHTVCIDAPVRRIGAVCRSCVLAAAASWTWATPAARRAAAAVRRVAPVVTTSSTSSTTRPRRGRRARNAGPTRRSERGLSCLWRTVGPIQQSAAGNSQLASNGLGDGLGLVVATSTNPAGAGRCPRDHVDVVEAKTIDHVRGKDARSGSAMTELESDDQLTGDALERNAAAMPSGLRIAATDARENRQRWHSTSPTLPQALQ